MSLRKVSRVTLHSPPQIPGYTALSNQIMAKESQGGTIRDIALSYDGNTLFMTLNKTVEIAIPAANVISMTLVKEEVAQTPKEVKK